MSSYETLWKPKSLTNFVWDINPLFHLILPDAVDILSIFSFLWFSFDWIFDFQSKPLNICHIFFGFLSNLMVWAAKIQYEEFRWEPLYISKLFWDSLVTQLSKQAIQDKFTFIKIINEVGSFFPDWYVTWCFGKLRRWFSNQIVNHRYEIYRNIKLCIV